MPRSRVFHGWWQVLVSFLALAVSGGGVMYTYSVVAVAYAEAFQPSRMVLMLGVTAMVLVGGLLSPWLGPLVDRYSIRRMMLFGSLSLALGYLALSLTTAMWQVILIYGVFMPPAMSLLGPLGTSTLLARWFNRRRSLALGVAAIGTSAGGLLFPPIISWLMEGFEWRNALRLYSLIGLAASLPWILLLVVDHPRERGLHPDGVPPAERSSGEAAAAAAEARHFSRTSAVLGNRNFWLIAVIIGCLFGTYSAMLSNLVPFALDIGITGERGALLLSMVALAGIPGKLGLGVLGDRLDLRLALGITMLLICAGLGCYIVSDSYPWLALGSVLLGLGAGGMLPIWGSMIGQVFGPSNYGRAMGLMAPVLMPFNVISPPLAGWLHDTTGSYLAAFGVFITALLLALLLLPFISPRSNTTPPKAAT